MAMSVDGDSSIFVYNNKETMQSGSKELMHCWESWLWLPVLGNRGKNNSGNQAAMWAALRAGTWVTTGLVAHTKTQFKYPTSILQLYASEIFVYTICWAFF